MDNDYTYSLAYIHSQRSKGRVHVLHAFIGFTYSSAIFTSIALRATLMVCPMPSTQATLPIWDLWPSTSLHFLAGDDCVAIAAVQETANRGGGFCSFLFVCTCGVLCVFVFVFFRRFPRLTIDRRRSSGRPSVPYRSLQRQIDKRRVSLYLRLPFRLPNIYIFPS